MLGDNLLRSKHEALTHGAVTHPMESFDIALIGAGIAGASLAWRLAEHARVVLVEREEQPGYHSTGRSAAMFMASYGPPMVRALTRASRSFYEAPPEGFTPTPILAPRGVLYVAAPGQLAVLNRVQAELQATGTALECCTREQALLHAPCLRPEQVAGALYEVDAMDIDVHALHSAYLRGFKRRGGTLLTSHELVAARHVGGAWELRFANGQALRAKQVVNAAGAWADAVAVMMGAKPLGVQPRRRSAFCFMAPEGVDARHWPTVCAIDDSWYFKPDAGQLLGSPANADDVPAHDVQPEAIDIATGIARIEAMTTLAIRRPTRTWAGLRSFAPDGELVVGHDVQVPGLFWLVGQGGYGIQSAAGAALLADSLLRGTPLPDLLREQGVVPAALAPARLA